MGLEDRTNNQHVIPERYRAVINPYASPRELRAEVRSLDRVVKACLKEGLSEEEIDRILLIGQEPSWKRHHQSGNSHSKY